MAKARSYLYVIGPEDQRRDRPESKVGRSNNPTLRRSQLQVGKGEKLKLYGQWLVVEGSASALEAKAHAALASVHVLGEVFRVDPALPCLVVRQIAGGGEMDDFLALALQHSATELRGDIGLAVGLMRQMIDMDPERAAEIDPISAGVHKQRAARSMEPAKRTLRPRPTRRTA